jgi:phage shock protein A
MIFKRIKTLWNGFWESMMKGEEDKHHRLLIEGTIREFHEKISQLKKALTTLIFQRRKLQRNFDELTHQIANYKLNLDKCVKTGKDQLALQIIAKMESMKEEAKFLKEQIQKLDNDIEQAKKVEKDLQSKVGRAGSKLRVLGNRIEALKLRKHLQLELSTASDSLKSWMPENNLQKLQDQVLQLEVEVEGIEGPKQLENELEQLEIENVESQHLDILDSLKVKLKVPKIVTNESALQHA